jgi:carbon storage regulator
MPAWTAPASRSFLTISKGFPMLCLSRKPGESIHIAGGIVITVVRLGGNAVKLGIDAPRNTSIMRTELMQDANTDGQQKGGK